MDIELTLINRSDSVPPPDVLIAQKDVLPALPKLVSAWKVIRHCPPSWIHPFVFSDEPEISISDEFGNYTPFQRDCEGGVFEVIDSHCGRTLTRTQRSTRPTDIIVTNKLRRGAVHAHLFSAGRVLGSRIGIAPGQKAVFQFKRALWIGIAAGGSRVNEGWQLAPAHSAALLTRLPLIGVTGADIVMSGGGARPIQFSLQNIRYS